MGSEPVAKPSKDVMPEPLPRQRWREPARVTGGVLADHLGMTRQNVSRLTAEGTLERTSAGYLLDDSRRRYIRHLREEYRKSPRALADADLQRHKAKLLEMKIARQQRETMLASECDEFMEEVIGLTLTELGGWPARVAGTDLVLRKKADTVLYELRVKIADLRKAEQSA
jgi:hypothetical protein